MKRTDKASKAPKLPICVCIICLFHFPSLHFPEQAVPIFKFCLQVLGCTVSDLLLFNRVQCVFSVKSKMACSDIIIHWRHSCTGMPLGDIGPDALEHFRLLVGCCFPYINWKVSVHMLRHMQLMRNNTFCQSPNPRTLHTASTLQCTVGKLFPIAGWGVEEQISQNAVKNPNHPQNID